MIAIGSPSVAEAQTREVIERAAAGIPGICVEIRRVLLALPVEASAKTGRVFIAPLGEKAMVESLLVARELREAGIATEADTRGGSLKSLLRRADGTGARLCLVMGESELEKNAVMLKDLAAHTQVEVPRAELVSRARELLQRPPGSAST